ncbi:hypothetical protein L484_011038 [Morus notabilis]|uniref:Uncharacterized protein n=1 Tax=Morus notabilis TaxID=981085 RepID=W9RR01_9ROSA|nr:hypothetical protein L484_011038 [Morus notabilis]
MRSPLSSLRRNKSAHGLESSIRGREVEKRSFVRLRLPAAATLPEVDFFGRLGSNRTKSTLLKVRLASAATSGEVDGCKTLIRTQLDESFPTSLEVLKMDA